MSNMVIDEKAMLEAEQAYDKAYWEYEVAREVLLKATKALDKAMKKMEFYIHD
jgi:hypothetical protein